MTSPPRSGSSGLSVSLKALAHWSAVPAWDLPGPQRRWHGVPPSDSPEKQQVRTGQERTQGCTEVELGQHELGRL